MRGGTEAQADTSVHVAVIPATLPPESPRAADGPEPRRRGGPALLGLLGLLAVLVLAAYVGSRALGSADTASGPTDPASGVIVGTPGGAVIPDPTPSSTPEPTPEQTVPTPSPVPQPQPQVAPVVTEAPIVATQAPIIATQAPAPPATQSPAPPPPDPTAVVVAVADPADVVAAFYAAVVDAQFDAAYSHWSERMRATYPRSENLDERFDSTAQITFHQLEIVESSGATATVQANFTETYDSGANRTFVGFWRLVQVDGRWLLDEPHY